MVCAENVELKAEIELNLAERKCKVLPRSLYTQYYSGIFYLNLQTVRLHRLLRIFTDSSLETLMTYSITELMKCKNNACARTISFNSLVAKTT